MKLKLITPDKMILERDVDSVTLPGKLGELTAMKGHDIMATALKSGRLYFKYVDDEEKVRKIDYDISGGMAEITKDRVCVFADSVAVIPA